MIHLCPAYSTSAAVAILRLENRKCAVCERAWGGRRRGRRAASESPLCSFMNLVLFYLHSHIVQFNIQWPATGFCFNKLGIMKQEKTETWLNDLSNNISERQQMKKKKINRHFIDIQKKGSVHRQTATLTGSREPPEKELRSREGGQKSSSKERLKKVLRVKWFQVTGVLYKRGRTEGEGKRPIGWHLVGSSLYSMCPIQDWESESVTSSRVTAGESWEWKHTVLKLQSQRKSVRKSSYFTPKYKEEIL